MRCAMSVCLMPDACFDLGRYDVEIQPDSKGGYLS